MISQHEHLASSQFGSKARAYLSSDVHAHGEDLDRIGTLAEQERPQRAIDLGAGAGHVAYQLAPHVTRVTALDVSAGMTAMISAEARTRGIENIDVCTAAVDAIPIADGTYDFLTCRYSAHHWRDLAAGLREARRVCRPGATAVLVDVAGPGYPPFDTHLQSIELLRDASHVRNHSAAQWMAALSGAGFRVRRMQAGRLRMDYPSWVDRMQTPDDNRIAIRALQHSATAETTAYYAIEPDGSFTVDSIFIEATACRARQMSS
jgi:ubiquinone/menaquinone biosynthesis C-methylase UbiE